ncbi:MAG: YlxM family DNA-binding protein [Peptostreptococcaceae bacterium]
MNIEKIVEINSLFEQYKFLLTEKQREIVSLYYEEDYSLGEISENLNVSRQGVYDTLKRSEKILKGYEDKLNLVEKLRLQEEFTENVLKDVTYLMNNFDNKDSTNLIPKLENIEKLCREMLK